MKITIAHLYYDLLNLYGECGNVRILKKILEEQNVDVVVKFLTVDDKLNFEDYDFVYMGMGIEDNLKIANKHLKKYKKDIQKYIEDGKYFICTGNSYELFGKEIAFESETIKTLGIFDYKSKTLEERKIMEISAKTDMIDKELIGFMNTGSTNDNKKENFLKNINNTDEDEGIIYKNFIGTYLIGPFLVRNPELLKLIVKKLIKEKDSKYHLKKINLDFLEKAYNDCLERRKQLI